MAAANHKAVMKRFMFDQEELKRSPVANVSAVPLEANMYEWHCNIRQDDIIYHLILFFPKDYPYSSPSAEFVPTGFQYHSGATKPGKKGTKICLNIFADFADVHTEWKNEKGLGWSPGYTIQTILMNVVAFLAETQATGSSSHSYKHNLNLSQNFKCPDCGHTYKEPFPALDTEENASDGPSKGAGKGKGTGKKGKGKTDADQAPAGGKSKDANGDDDNVQIIDYISKEKFVVQKPEGVDDLWGYGLAVSGTNWRPTLTSPCEFITGRSFYGMKKAVKVVHSVLKEELQLFLPLFIHPLHGSEIKEEFERTLKEVAKIMPKYDPKTTPIEDLVLKTLPNLMSATVVEFSKGTQHTSDNSLNGYFALHRLLLWAVDTYPDLQAKIEEQVKAYVEDENNRTKQKVPYIAEWLMLVAGSQKYRWRDVADAYLAESWKRNVIWYVKDDAKLGYLDTPKDYRIKQTFKQTEVARKHLAFQASFLNIAMPEGMSRDAIIKRYDDNLGFPTKEMVATMKETFTKINTQMNNYQDWFKILKLPVPSDDELYTIMVEGVRFSILTPGYHWSSPKTGGGWGPVMTKYADMIKEHKEKTKAASGGDEEAAGKSSKAKGKGGEDKAEEDKGKGKAARGRGASRGRGKSAARGQKRKAESDDDDDDDDNGKAAKGRGRGRGRGGAVKKRR